MFERLLELVFPKFCFGCGSLGHYLCEKCQNQIERYQTNFCPECGRAAIGGLTHSRCAKNTSLDGLVCLFPYQDPLRKALHQLKYKFGREIVRDLEPLLAQVNLARTFEKFTLVPIALNEKRENWRGFNQSALLGEMIAHRFNLAFEENYLKREKLTRPQVELKLRERRKNLAKSFSVNTSEKVAGSRLLVFDDIWTSGATLREAAKELKKAGAEKVWGLAFATSHKVH